MKRAALLVSFCLCAPTFVQASASADVIAIDPFEGEFSDTFNQFDSVHATQALDVFDGLGTLRNLTDGGAIKVEFSSNFNGDLVVPLGDMMAGQIGIAQWDFDAPLSRFGGSWENNSGQDDATIEFFDSNGQLIDTAFADIPVNGQSWTWNGWESSVPFSSVRVTGNGVFNGFLWYENMQIQTVPTPGAAGLLVLFACDRRRR